MKDFDIVIKIGSTGINEDEAIDKYKEILFFIQDNLPLENFSIDIIERGEYVDG